MSGVQFLEHNLSIIIRHGKYLTVYQNLINVKS